MAIPNIINLINSTEPFASLDADTKQSMLDNFCEARYYKAELGDTKVNFANKQIMHHILTLAKGQYEEVAKDNLAITIPFDVDYGG